MDESPRTFPPRPLFPRGMNHYIVHLHHRDGPIICFCVWVGGGSLPPGGYYEPSISSSERKESIFYYCEKHIIYNAFAFGRGCGVSRIIGVRDSPPLSGQQRASFPRKKEVGCGCCVNVLDFIHDYHFKKKGSAVLGYLFLPPRPVPPHPTPRPSAQRRNWRPYYSRE